MTARDRTVLVVLGIAAVLAGFWFAALGPRRSEARRLDQEVQQATRDRDAAFQAAASARAAQRSYARDYATVARLGEAVPSDDDTASLLYQLQAAAGASKVSLDALSVGGGGGASASSTSTTSTTAGTSSATQAAAAPLPPGATVGPAGLSKMGFTLTFTGTFFDLERLLRRVHSLTSVSGDAINVHGRLLSVDALSLKPDDTGFPKVTASLSVTAYLAAKPSLPAAPPAGATAGGSTVPVNPPSSGVPAPTTAATAIGVGG
jgi:hypothetical protein